MTDGHPEDNNYHIFLTAMHVSDVSPSTAQWTPTENEKIERWMYTGRDNKTRNITYKVFKKGIYLS